MRRPLVLLTLLAALLSASAASASFRPINRNFGDVTLPRVRAGVVRIPAGHSRGRVTVIARLSLPPLAAAQDLRPLSLGAAERLNVRSATSRAYLARLAHAQRTAAAVLHREIPSARVTHRYRIVLDGLSVDLPVKALPKLTAMGFVTKVYPSVRYAATLNDSPSIIGATALTAATGSRGDGIKIGVVDTGVDVHSPFLDPTGYSYPPGFPKGGLRWTSPKVIVARSFPGPGSDRAGRLAFDRTEPHGTHVSGIAAGDAGTNAPAEKTHPAVAGLSGVAPRAWIGNYRVFTVPTPVGHVGNTPEIAAAFEAAVADGMNVINFSGGGAQTEPANDALVEVVHNVVAAGVVPVIAAGNDRDEFGLGSVGSPGTAPDAISVAAVSNSHVFSPSFGLTAAGAPATLRSLPFESDGNRKPPASWADSDKTLVDVGTVLGTDGNPVDRHLCGLGSPNTGGNPLPRHSLDGVVALASRGSCTFFSKSERARRAGAIGLVLVDNRPGEPNPVPILARIPIGMIGDLDGSRLRAFIAGTGGRTTFRVSSSIEEIVTGRSGILTSFSSAGPTGFGHQLKPDIAAPGGQILSSTPPAETGSVFSVFDGTSMATPHVAGAAALLVQRHPGWSAPQIKSALVSTAGPAWADTARTVEAPVLLEGGGLANVAAADDPRVFFDPVSLSFDDVDVHRGYVSRSKLVTIDDAGGGAGTWQVELRPQSATPGATISIQSTVDLAPGGTATLPVIVRAGADAGAGQDYGFIVLRQGAIERRIPYAFLVTRPGLALSGPVELKRIQTGDTRLGASRASVYCCPSEPFGPPPTYTGPAMDEAGAEHVYVTHVDRNVANVGVSILASTPGSLIDPWFLGSLDENDVQGYAGTPVNVNDLTFDAHLDIGAAGAEFPLQKEYFVSVDSGRDPFTGRSLGGRYLLNSWVDDVQPPLIGRVTTRVAAGHPLIVARTLDFGAGVDPLSLALSYKKVLVGAAAYDPFTGFALFPLPAGAPALKPGKTRALVIASDYQESKNVNTVGADIMPNTAYARVELTVVKGPAVTWILPEPGCVGKRTRLVVAASATTKIREVRFLDSRSTIGVDRKGPGGIYAVDWKTKDAKRGEHRLHAVVVDRTGASATAARTVRVCRK